MRLTTNLESAHPSNFLDESLNNILEGLSKIDHQVNVLSQKILELEANQIKMQAEVQRLRHLVHSSDLMFKMMAAENTHSIAMALLYAQPEEIEEIINWLSHSEINRGNLNSILSLLYDHYEDYPNLTEEVLIRYTELLLQKGAQVNGSLYDNLEDLSFFKVLKKIPSGPTQVALIKLHIDAKLDFNRFSCQDFLLDLDLIEKEAQNESLLEVFFQEVGQNLSKEDAFEIIQYLLKKRGEDQELFNELVQMAHDYSLEEIENFLLKQK